MAKIVKIEGCIGCGACAGVAPDVFEINADGVAECIFGEEIDDAYEADATEAAGACPVSAITVE